jgi:SAM-dependent methyltransferase
MMTSQRSREAICSFIQAAWAGVAPAWEAHADDLDARTASITERLIELADLQSGESVLELASGPGGVGLAAAELVGGHGSVVISDVVPQMVDAVRRRAAARELTNVTAKVLDLEAIAEPDASYEVVLCREGLMFALDPARAVKEMRRVLRPRGRVAVAVWAEKAQNPWLALLLDAITEVTGVVVPPEGLPGPFALADAERLQTLFTDAGFLDLTLDTVSAPVRAPSFDAWWDRTCRVAGPAVAILNAADDVTRERIRVNVCEATSPFADPDGQLRLPGLALVIAGRRS